MPRLLHFFQNPSSCPGGTEKMMERISEVASRLGFECREVYQQLYRLRATSRRYPMLDTPGNILQMTWLARAELKKADVVISHGVYGPLWCPSPRIHVLHSTHAGTAEAMKPHVPWLDYRVARHLWGATLEGRHARRSRCVAVSRFAADQAKRFYGCQPQVISNVANPIFQPQPEARQGLREQLGLQPEQKLVLVVGRRERIKGWAVCQAMLDQLPSETVLLSIGQGPAPAHPRLITLDPMPPAQLSAYYSAADWTLSPSLYEGFGLTILEAWACGCPVLATPTGLASDLLGLEPAFDRCVAARTDDPQALLQVIHQSVSREDWSGAQVTWGQSLLQTRFSSDAFEQDWKHLLMSTLKGASLG